MQNLGLLVEVADLCLDARIDYHEATLLQQEKYLQRALERSEGNISRAARLVAMHRNQLAKKLADLGLKDLPRRIREARRTPQLLLFSSGRPARNLRPAPAKTPSSSTFQRVA